MTAKRNARKVEFTPAQRAEQHQLRELFQDWHPSPEELIASGEGADFALFVEYAGLRPFLAELKQAREEAGLSLADVARRCGIDKAALSRLEKGQDANPSLDTLWRYAAGLGKRLTLGAADIAPTRPPATKPAPRTKKKPAPKKPVLEQSEGSNRAVARPRNSAAKG